jgi:hypothetical protein
MRKVSGVIAGTALALGAALTVASPASAAIQERGCSSTTATWVHVATQVNGEQCFGFQGYTPVDEWVYSLYAGNNCGYWIDSNGNSHYFAPYGGFNSGSNTSFLAALQIDGWVGHGC